MEKIAIVGMGFQLPGGLDSREKLWDALSKGADAISEIPDERWNKQHFYHPNAAGKSYVFSAGVVERVTEFDAEFFGISPREASQMDPQQRLLLENAWAALEDAGQVPSELEGSNCAVYVAIAGNDAVLRRQEDVASVDGYFMTGNTASVASNRISYALDLRGPSMSVDTACSSSLVALHQACQSLRCGESSSAIVAGVNVLLAPTPFIGFSQASMLAPDGKCRPFDKDGAGYVRSEGCAAVYLKPLKDAERDGDRIHAVIVNTAANCDGRTNGISVPSREGQKNLLEKVYQDAGIAPDQIDYIEAHGTGTPVGDPIEASALGEAISRKRNHLHALPIGSVKGNVGHLETASGMAGLIKAVLCLKYRQIPPTANHTAPNRHIDMSAMNLDVVSQMRDMQHVSKALLIGVNSFGFGGANAHTILQEHQSHEPPVKPECATQQSALAEADQTVTPLIVSGATEAAVQANAQALARWLDTHPWQWPSVAAHCAHRKERLAQSVVLECRSVKDAQSQLSALSKKGLDGTCTGSRVTQNAEVALVFSGNGCQWAGMGKRLLEESPVFADTVAEIQTYLGSKSELDLRAAFLAEADQSKMHLTEVAQPLLFTLQVGIVRMLQSMGLRPALVLGHSVGEVAAAWASGGMSLKQACHVIRVRSEAQGLTRGTGRMAAVGVSADTIDALLREMNLHNSIELAAVNSRSSVTLAGTLSALEKVCARLVKENKFARLLDFDYAFHSRYMDPIEGQVVQGLASLRPSKEQITFISSVTGSPFDTRGLSGEYWWDNVRKPVQFSRALDCAIEAGAKVFVEVGSHPILRSYLNEQLRNADVKGAVIATVERYGDEVSCVRSALYRAWMSGCKLDLSKLVGPDTFVDNLPPYQWQRKRYEPPVTTENIRLASRAFDHPLLGYSVAPGDVSVWQRHLDANSIDSFADHKVGDAVVLPGAAYAEIGFAIAIQTKMAAPVVEDLEILAPLVLDNSEPKLIQTEWDRRTGRYTVSSRERGEDASWLIHATARIADVPVQTRGEMNAEQAESKTTVDRVQHYKMAAEIGLNYGPDFQVLDAVDVLQARAVARLKPSSSVLARLADYSLHPALLDGGFQALVPVLRAQANHSTHAMLPVRMSRIRVFDRSADITRIELSIVGSTPRSVLVDFVLFDASGAVVAEASGCRFKAAKLAATTRRPQTYREYIHAHPNLFTYRETALPPLSQWLHSLHNHPRVERSQRKFAYVSEELNPLLNLAVVSGAFHSLQLLSNDQRLLDVTSLLQQDRLDSEQLYLFYHLVEALQDQALAEKTDLGIRLVEDPELPSVADIWQTLDAEYPEASTDILRVMRQLERLPQTLAGLTSGVARDEHPEYRNLWSAQAEAHLLALLEAVSGDTHHARTLVVAQQLPHSVVDWVEQNRARIQIEFAVACVELHEAQRYRLAQLGITLHTYDPTTGVVDNSELGRFDLLVLSNLMPMVTDPSKTLAFYQTCGHAGARMMVFETAPQLWHDLVYGQHEDWWHRSTDVRTPQSPRAFVSDWRALIEQQGYASTLDWVPLAGDDQYLIVFDYAPNDSLPQRAPAQLARMLVIQSPNAEAAQRLVEDSSSQLMDRSGQPVFEQIEHNWGSASEALGAKSSRLLDELGWQVLFVDCDTDIASLTLVFDLAAAQSNDPVKAVQDACGSLLALVNSPESEQGFTLNVVTLSGFDDQSAPRLSPASAGVWGFCRVLRAERPELQLQLMDLDTLEQSYPVLLDEICTPDAESEILIRNGQRFVVRIDEVMTEWKLEPVVDKKLDFEEPGQLKNLTWMPMTPAKLEAGQIRVKPLAVGLNFRDVMFAMGMLPDEALESGFSGPTLGMEFAGEVVEVAGDVSSVSVGQAVMGFAPACFASSTVTSAASVAPIPEGWSPEQAATVPTTYLTAHYAIVELARARAQESILIHGGAGGVGIAAIAIAKRLGLQIYATAGSDEKREFLRKLGVHQVLDSRSLHFADALMSLTQGEGVDIVLNSLAGEAIHQNLAILKPFGRFLELGKRDFYENNLLGLRPFRNNISYFGIDADQLMSARPSLASELFKDVMAQFAADAYRPLPHRVFDASQIDAAFRYMQQSRQIGKVVVDCEVLPVASTQQRKAPNLPALDPDGTYLVSGGTRGFGFKTAQWLAAMGAKKLILVGRSGVKEAQVKRRIHSLRNRGISIKVWRCDLADLEKLSTLWTQLEDSGVELKGVVHAAMVLDDKFAQNMDCASLEKVLKPKAQGAWNLHLLTQHMDLDFFVSYSSITTFLGNPGQANYVAANKFLEGLSALRNAQGLPSSVVAWGAIADVGYLTGNEAVLESLEKRTGGRALETRDALEFLGRVIQEQVPQVAYADVDWSTVYRYLPSVGSPTFSLLPFSREKALLGDTEDLALAVRDLPQAEARQLIESVLVREISVILRLSEEAIDTTQSVFEFGMDSLTGVELASAIEQRFSVKLPTMLLSEGPSISKIANKLYDLIVGDSAAPSGEVDFAQLASRHQESLSENELSELNHSMSHAKPQKLTT